jgi:hypothetical protein
VTRPRVVVVDSGVDAHHPALRGIDVVRGPTFAADGTTGDGPHEADVLGHGTAVAATLVRFLPPGTPLELVSLRVFERAPTCDFAAVLAALRHALTLAPALVNLSLGTTSLRWRAPLEALVGQLRANGARLVAPASYGGLACDPGNLAGVDAVVADPNVLPMLPELRRDGARWVWFASPLPPPARDGVRALLARGDSLAVAAVSGCLLRSVPR